MATELLDEYEEKLEEEYREVISKGNEAKQNVSDILRILQEFGY